MLDLFPPIVPIDALHPNFRVLADPEMSGPEQAALQNWIDGFIDRDNKIVREFQTTFNSAFWEFYLNAAFRELGCTPDYSLPSPDFVLDSPFGPFIAEAVTAGHPAGSTPEWERNLRIDAKAMQKIEEFLYVASIRLSSAITAKSDLYNSKYSKLEHVLGKPFVVCVAPFESPHFFAQNDNAIRRVLYGFDRPLFRDDYGTREFIGEARILEVINKNGTFLPLGFFARPGMENVSAVIFSNTATYTKLRAVADKGSYRVDILSVRYNANDTKPKITTQLRGEYKESILDGLHVFLNPYARYPFPVELVRGREITVHSYLPETQEYFPDPPDGFLIQHGSIAMPPHHLAKRYRQIKTSKKYQEYELPAFPDGRLVPFESNVKGHTNNYLAHYRNWTILVAKHDKDDDWSALAIPGYYYTLGGFQQANKEKDLILGKWLATAQDAFEAMRKHMDQELDLTKKRRKRARHTEILLKGYRKKSRKTW